MRAERKFTRTLRHFVNFLNGQFTRANKSSKVIPYNDLDRYRRFWSSALHRQSID